MNLIQKTYAESLIKLDTISRTDVLADLNKINDTIMASEDLYKVLQTPTVNSETKIQILTDIFEKEISKPVLNFLKILAEKNRFGDFEGIIKAFKEKSDEIDGIKAINVTSAIELKDDYKAQIISKLSSKLGKKINANWEIDKSIIGGLVIKIDDSIIDTSIKYKLDKLMKGNI